MPTKKLPEQSCGTCKYGRFHSNGQFMCHGDAPQLVVVEKQVLVNLVPVPPDFWGCRHYVYTSEEKVLPRKSVKPADKTID